MGGWRASFVPFYGWTIDWGVISAPLPPEYLSRLNPEQREAVEAVDGPLLVLAGAGTTGSRALAASATVQAHAANPTLSEVMCQGDVAAAVRGSTFAALQVR